MASGLTPDDYFYNSKTPLFVWLDSEQTAQKIMAHYMTPDGNQIVSDEARRALQNAAAEMKIERRPLTPEHISAARAVARALADVVNIPGAAKSINSAVSEYENTLQRFAFDVLNGNSDAIDFRRAHKALLKATALSVFEEGWKEGGGKLEDTEPDDIALYKDWEREQAGYVNDFAAWLVTTDENGKRNWEMKRRQLAERLAAWALAAQNMGEQAAARAKGDPYLTFDGSDGEESCDECQEFKGQRHRLSWWERRGLLKRNGNDNYGCGRWEPCHHHFYYDDGKVAVE